MFWGTMCPSSGELTVSMRQWRTDEGLGGSAPPPEIPKALHNRAKLNPIVKTDKTAEFRTPTLKMFGKKAVKF